MPEFLPISKKDMDARGWTQCDFVYIIGDAYVDHPSFGYAIISRVLEDAGYKSASSRSRTGKSPSPLRRSVSRGSPSAVMDSGFFQSGCERMPTYSLRPPARAK